MFVSNTADQATVLKEKQILLSNAVPAWSTIHGWLIQPSSPFGVGFHEAIMQPKD